jgi:protein O-GlcNAc transferase
MKTETHSSEVEALLRQRAAEAERENSVRHERLLAEALAGIKKDERDPHRYISAARTCKLLGRLREALEILQRGIALCAPSASLYEYYVERLEKCNRTEEAVTLAREASALFPDDWVFRLRAALALPIFYDSRQQIEACRRRFTDNLHRIIAELPLETPADRRRALSAVSRSSNKYLPYQGYNDCKLQVAWGAWVHRVMAVNYPHFAEPEPLPRLRGKIRVGFLTAFSTRFLQLSAGKLFGGWIRELDRSKFEVFAYHADNLAAPGAETIPHWKIPFRQLSGDWGAMAQAIRSDRLHTLIYLDFGIHPRMAQLAALRLAPFQCVAWDTPLTSGAPAMDYFLSSELMEPGDVSGHYSEELVRLPGVGVSFAKPVIPTMLFTKTRTDFGLREDAFVYLCCQSIFKYSPEQDELVARIAQRVPNAQFVFLITNELAGNDFKRRLESAFSAAGLRAEKYCVWLPEMDVLDYWNLLQLGDVSLDTLFWSGGVSTFEAIACGLPVVTLPGELMRARHYAAILSQLGVTETIARDATEYVAIAAVLGQDRDRRRSIVRKMETAYPALYSDPHNARALETFLLRVVRERLRRNCVAQRSPQ